MCVQAVSDGHGYSLGWDCDTSDFMSSQKTNKQKENKPTSKQSKIHNRNKAKEKSIFFQQI